jgi:hypothetical protein
LLTVIALWQGALSCIKMNSSPSCLMRGITRGLMTSSNYLWPFTVPILKRCRSARPPVQIAAQTIRLAPPHLSCSAAVQSANLSAWCLQTHRRPSLKSKQNLDSLLNTTWHHWVAVHLLCCLAQFRRPWHWWWLRGIRIAGILAWRPTWWSRFMMVWVEIRNPFASWRSFCSIWAVTNHCLLAESTKKRSSFWVVKSGWPLFGKREYWSVSWNRPKALWFTLPLPLQCLATSLCEDPPCSIPLVWETFWSLKRRLTISRQQIFTNKMGYVAYRDLNWS